MENINLKIDVKEVCNEYEKGVSIDELARKYGVRTDIIKYSLIGNGFNISRNINSPSDLQKKICKEYLQGVGSSKLTKKYGLTYPTLLQILKGNDIQLRGGKRKISLDDEKIICYKYIEGTKVSELAGIYNVASVTIHRLLKSKDIKLDRVRAQTKFTLKEEIMICDEYVRGASAKALSKKYHVHLQTIGRILNRNGVIVAKNKITSEIENKICKEYEENATTGELAIKYDVSRKTILKYLNKNKIKLKLNTKGEKPRISSEEEKKICAAYLNGLSSIKIGKTYNRNPNTIIRVVERNNIEIRSGGRIKGGLIKKINTDDVVSICKEYDLGATTYDLANEYNVTPMTIHKILKSHNINIRKRGEHTAIFSSKDHKKLCDLYLNGVNSYEIARQYNCNPKSIINILNKYEIERRDNIRENNHNWRGGVSFEPYCYKFNEKFKEKCRKHWKRKCGICGMDESKHIKIWYQKLSVHHVSYNKQALCNDVSNLFIPLCKTCHNKTNSNRGFWETYLTNYLMIWKDGRTY